MQFIEFEKTEFDGETGDSFYKTSDRFGKSKMAKVFEGSDVDEIIKK